MKLQYYQSNIIIFSKRYGNLWKSNDLLLIRSKKRAITAARFSSDCNQMLIFTVAGFILALTGLYIRIIKK